ncbi:MAG: hypothetical protein ACR2FF_07805 [Mycobacteriales bacterium]|nr:MAG: hypothetical protein DLM56_00180 [Pseudonocardiales bacterium]
MSNPLAGRRSRYGVWHGGRDPLEPPFDARSALDEIGEDILAGESPLDALRRLLRQGTDGLPGLDTLRRKLREQRRAARRRGSLDGTLQRVKELLERAVESERQALFPDPSDAARLSESELDTLPADPARAVRQLSEYQWRSDDARAAYEQIRDLLRREVLDSHFRGMKQALEGATPQDMARVKDMLADLNAMLAADARGEHTQQQFHDFMSSYGDFFPEQPADLAELVDSLARRSAAQQRMMASLSDEQRQELADLMAGALSDAGLASEVSALQQQLRSARPDLPWRGREQMRGERPLGLGDATTVLEELADFDELDSLLDQDYAGATLDDVDPELVERALGRSAREQLDALRQIEHELDRQGYLTRENGRLELSPRAVRRIGQVALRRVFADIEATGRGGHDVTDAGAAGELTGASRAWRFGDEQPLDVAQTVRNAVLRAGRDAVLRAGRDGPDGVRLSVDDFEVVETERRTSAAVALLVDLSYSMALRGTWGVAKSTALALHSLVSTRYPQDAIEIIGFSNYARVLSPTELAGLSWDMVQGTNLQHALMLAGRHLAKHPEAEPVVLVITDGEPTAHLADDGHARFAWPPLPETVATTYAEVERVTRRGATINVFMLADDPGLVAFVDKMAQRNGGRVFSPEPGQLGEYVVRDYLRARRGRNRGARRF